MARPAPAFLTPQVLQSVQHGVMQLIERFGEKELERVLHAVAIITGDAPEPQLDPMQRPGMLYIPGLPERRWTDADTYPETRQVADILREAWPKMREEYLAFMAAQGRLQSYVPPEQAERYLQAGMTRFDDWSGLFMNRDGRKYEEHYEAMPETARTLERLAPYLMVQHESFFSVFRPGTVLKPHCDATNAKLSVHLGVIIPEKCGIKVGGIERRWVEGETYYFDETFEHEAWNLDTTPRVCFLSDIWHPELTQVERIALSALIETATSQGNLAA
ncbi:aspartyl/asparaginyl beta-hydroxylase domain-containing protein [Cystobacter ferrugineus]|uniref:Aspartyl/asparaginy/proline hydroxylase domain-containing protein n=1 Tax=Cystobacter ferrugineus TaxID=83449 RepID=A0A1L9B8J6_9BACT|nr:aspartyl/asparaginyl beta-hydroxylase domain-containing protein [Cystobacter ferrugineus]OJH38580.1 hypothetical protein BON30_20265 [Cystobacter ferrugineus]